MEPEACDLVYRLRGIAAGEKVLDVGCGTGSLTFALSKAATLNDAPFMAIAGLWRDGEGNKPPTFAMLTTEPGPDVAPTYNRQIVVLRPGDWAAWLHLTKPEAELMKALPAGSLAMETIREGSD